MKVRTARRAGLLKFIGGMEGPLHSSRDFVMSYKSENPIPFNIGIPQYGAQSRIFFCESEQLCNFEGTRALTVQPWGEPVPSRL